MKQLSIRIAPAVVAAVALAACGADEPPATAPSDSLAQPPVDAAMRAPTPVEFYGGGAAGATPMTAPAGEVAATSEMMIAFGPVEYRVSGDLPALPADDTGYVYDAAAPVSVDEVRRIADAFGVEGEPISLDDGFGAGWRVGPDDGSAGSLWAQTNGSFTWNYNAPWTEDDVVVSCAVTVDSEGNESGDCPVPEPPTGVPSEAEAQQRAADVLQAIGVDAGGVTFETYADEWFASVSATDAADARGPIRSWNFGFRGEGVLSFASGSLSTPEPVGPYPLVDVDTAVARLSEGVYGGGFEFGVATPAFESGVAEEPAIGAVDGTIVPGPPPVASMPVEPGEPGEPVVVELVDVRADLWWAYASDGSVWLLPAYRFIDADGGSYTTPAVTEEFLIMADPNERPIPVEGDGGIGDGAEPLPQPLPAEPAPGVPEPTPIEPGTDPAAVLALVEPFVGFSIEEFTAEAEALGLTTRIIQQDGEFLPVTEDLRFDRVNVVVEGPRVIAIDSIG